MQNQEARSQNETRKSENALRAVDAAAAVTKYLNRGRGDKDDLRATIVDLVTDLHHLLETEGFDAEDAMRIAHWHYIAERVAEARV